MDRTFTGTIHRGIAEEISRREIPGVRVLEGYRSGSVLITYDDFAYVVNIRKNKVIYLKCRNRNCNGSALITFKEGGNSQIQHGSPHLHPPDIEYIETVKFRCELRSRHKQTSRPRNQNMNQVSSRSQKVTLEQQEILVSFMELHPQLAYGLGHDQQSKQKSRILWSQLTKTLNKAEGPSRPLEKWRKVWKSWRTKLKRQRESLGKQNLFRRKHHLTSLEERVLALKRPLRRESLEESADYDMDETSDVNDTAKSFQELVAAIKTIDESDEAEDCATTADSGGEDEHTYTTAYYDGVQGEEIILELPADSYTYSNETPTKNGRSEDNTGSEVLVRQDVLSKLTGSMERMENTLRNMDDSLKELINTVKMLVQLQQGQVS